MLPVVPGLAAVEAVMELEVGEAVAAVAAAIEELISVTLAGVLLEGAERGTAPTLDMMSGSSQLS